MVAWQAGQDWLVERRAEPARVFGQPEPELDPGELGDDLADPLLLGERLAAPCHRDNSSLRSPACTATYAISAVTTIWPSGSSSRRSRASATSGATVSARPRMRSSISRREAAKKSAFLDSSPSRSSARTCRLSSDTSRVSAATVSSHRCALSRASASPRWAATSASLPARSTRTSSSSGPQWVARAASSASARTVGSPVASACFTAATAKGTARLRSRE